MCKKKNKKEVNIQMDNLYNKVRKSSRAVADLPEARAMRYVPYEITHKIAQSPKRSIQLQKSRLIQKWLLSQYHLIPFCGLHNIYKILTTPNGTKFTICQVIMSIKLVEDLITLLFVKVIVSPKIDVVVICDISMKEKAEGLFSHFGIYAAVIFCSIVWEAFTVSYKTSMKPFQYYPVLCCAIERDISTIVSNDSFNCEFSSADSPMT